MDKKGVELVSDLNQRGIALQISEEPTELIGRKKITIDLARIARMIDFDLMVNQNGEKELV